MSGSRSTQSARYGALAERFAFKRYGLEPSRNSWRDGLDDDGDPWDVKAAMLTRRQPRFRVWQEQYRRLRRDNGGFVFIGYRPVGRGIAVDGARTVRARSLKLRFGGSGDHPKDDRQAKIAVDRVL